MPPFLESEVESAFKKLKIGKTSSPDTIDKIFKILEDLLVPQLPKLLNQMLQMKQVPYQWEMAEIILLFKKGDRQKIKNYRPINITTNLSKIFNDDLKKKQDIQTTR